MASAAAEFEAYSEPQEANFRRMTVVWELPSCSFYRCWLCWVTSCACTSRARS